MWRAVWTVTWAGGKANALKLFPDRRAYPVHLKLEGRGRLAQVVQSGKKRAPAAGGRRRPGPRRTRGSGPSPPAASKTAPTARSQTRPSRRRSCGTTGDDSRAIHHRRPAWPSNRTSSQGARARRVLAMWDERSLDTGFPRLWSYSIINLGMTGGTEPMVSKIIAGCIATNPYAPAFAK